MFARVDRFLFDEYVSLDRQEEEPACSWSKSFDKNKRPTCPLTVAQTEEKERALEPSIGIWYMGNEMRQCLAVVVCSYSLTHKASE